MRACSSPHSLPPSCLRLRGRVPGGRRDDGRLLASAKIHRVELNVQLAIGARESCSRAFTDPRYINMFLDCKFRGDRVIFRKRALVVARAIELFI